MLISKASKEDIPELNKLINAAYLGEESKKGWTTEAEILGGIRIDEQTLKHFISNKNITILKYAGTDGEILGTVYLELKVPELYLGLFAVSPLFQGKGIGKALLHEAEIFALANGCNRIAITVISSRYELIDWYERHSYVATGKTIAFNDIQGKFGDPKQADIKLIAMEKSLI